MIPLFFATEGLLYLDSSLHCSEDDFRCGPLLTHKAFYTAYQHNLNQDQHYGIYYRAQ